MNEGLKTIWSGPSGDVDQQKLMDYLSGALPPDEREKMEQNMADNPFLQDAVAGLQQTDKRNLGQIVGSLNKDLRKGLAGSNRDRTKKIGSMEMSIYALITILILALVAYTVVRMLHQ